MRVMEASFRAFLDTLDVWTPQAPQFVDITEHVAGIVDRSVGRSATARAFSQHTKMATVTREAEPLLMTGRSSFVERLAPRGAHYRHDDFPERTVNMHEDGSPSGHSHRQHPVLGASETAPVVDGRMALGQRRRAFAVELDADRTLQIDSRRMAVQVPGV